MWEFSKACFTGFSLVVQTYRGGAIASLVLRRQPNDDPARNQCRDEDACGSDSAYQQLRFYQQNESEKEHHYPGDELEDPSVPLAQLTAAEGDGEQSDDAGQWHHIDHVVEGQVEVVDRHRQGLQGQRPGVDHGEAGSADEFVQVGGKRQEDGGG